MPEIGSRPKPPDSAEAAHDWSFRRPGPPGEEVERVRDVLHLAATVTGWTGAPSPREPIDQVTAETALTGAETAVVERLRAGGPQVTDDAARSELVALLTNLGQTRIALRDAVLAHRSATQVHLAEALHRLRDVSSVQELIERAPKEIHALGFGRGLLSRITNSRWVTESCYVDKDPEFAALIVAVGRAHPVLVDERLLETDMIHTGEPLLENDPEHNPRIHHTLRRATQTRSYVAAPVTCQGKPFGFVHADGFPDPRKLDVFDRDTLAMFGEGFGYAVERVLLAERLLDVRGKMDEYSGLVTDLIDRFVESDLRRRARWAKYDRA
jgi:GAF domain-containing protein